MGGYGFIRFFFRNVSYRFRLFCAINFTLSVIAIIYTSLVALMQEDMKKLVAYSSIAHMGFVTLGIFTFNKQGIEGSIYRCSATG